MCHRVRSHGDVQRFTSCCEGSAESLRNLLASDSVSACSALERWRELSEAQMLERSRKALGAMTGLHSSQEGNARFDVAVIGSGMGGWAAVRAARRRGRRVALFESGAVGGT